MLGNSHSESALASEAEEVGLVLVPRVIRLARLFPFVHPRARG